MAVKLKLKLFGRRHRPFYRLAAMDARTRRDGSVLEELGTYEPTNPDPAAQVKFNPDRIRHWLSVGAQPTETVRQLLEKQKISAS